MASAAATASLLACPLRPTKPLLAGELHRQWWLAIRAVTGRTSLQISYTGPMLGQSQVRHAEWTSQSSTCSEQLSYTLACRRAGKQAPEGAALLPMFMQPIQNGHPGVSRPFVVAVVLLLLFLSMQTDWTGPRTAKPRTDSRALKAQPVDNTTREATKEKVHAYHVGYQQNAACWQGYD